MENSNISAEKKIIRKIVSTRKKECSVQKREAYSESVIGFLTEMNEFVRAENILFYWSLPDEVSTHYAVERFALSKNIFLPKVNGGDLLIKRFLGTDGLVAGESFSIPEPNLDSPEVSIDEIDLVVVPGVAFDKNGGRMGRGKGFYDKLLRHRNASPLKIGICFDFQLVERVPREPHDVLMDAVVSQSGVFYPESGE